MRDYYHVRAVTVFGVQPHVGARCGAESEFVVLEIVFSRKNPESVYFVFIRRFRFFGTHFAFYRFRFDCAQTLQFALYGGGGGFRRESGYFFLYGAGVGEQRQVVLQFFFGEFPGALQFGVFRVIRCRILGGRKSLVKCDFRFFARVIIIADKHGIAFGYAVYVGDYEFAFDTVFFHTLAFGKPVAVYGDVLFRAGYQSFHGGGNGLEARFQAYGGVRRGVEGVVCLANRRVGLHVRAV